MKEFNTFFIERLIPNRRNWPKYQGKLNLSRVRFEWKFCNIYNFESISELSLMFILFLDFEKSNSFGNYWRFFLNPKNIITACKNDTMHNEIPIDIWIWLHIRWLGCGEWWRLKHYDVLMVQWPWSIETTK